MLDKESFNVLIITFILVLFTVVPISALISWLVYVVSKHSILGGSLVLIAGLFLLVSFIFYLCNLIARL